MRKEYECRYGLEIGETSRFILKSLMFESYNDYAAKQQECFASRAYCLDVDFNQMKETIMNKTFNRDILAGQWKQVRGQVRQNWGKLTDNDLDRISGTFEELVGLVQERYGYARDKAETEVTNFVERFTMKEPHNVK